MQKIILLSLASFIIFYSSCEESEEGCLDFFSSNYNFQAVTSCDSCCTFPAASLNLTIGYGEEDFRFSRDTFFTESNDTLILHNLELLLSKFHFLGIQNNYTVRDTVVNTAKSVTDDFVFFKSGGLKEIGRTRFTDTLETLNVLLGFEEQDLNELKPFSNLNQESELDEALDSLYSSTLDKYYTGRFEVQLFDSIRRIDIPNELMNNNLSFDVLVPVNPGATWNVDLRLDVKLLLEGLNKSMSNEDITTVLSQNLVRAFYVE